MPPIKLATKAALEALAAGVYTQGEVDAEFARQSDTPTLEELCATSLCSAVISATQAYPVFVAPFPCRIMAFEWGFDLPVAGLPSSPTAYWELRLRKNGTSNIAVQSLQNAARNRRTGYNFDALTFDATHKVLAKDDYVDFVWVINGAPNQPQFINTTIRYEPL